MKEVSNRVHDKLYNVIEFQVWLRTYDKVEDPVSILTENDIEFPVWAQISNLVGNQIKNNVKIWKK